MAINKIKTKSILTPQAPNGNHKFRRVHCNAPFSVCYNAPYFFTYSKFPKRTLPKITNLFVQPPKHALLFEESPKDTLPKIFKPNVTVHQMSVFDRFVSHMVWLFSIPKTRLCSNFVQSQNCSSLSSLALEHVRTSSLATSHC